MYELICVHALSTDTRVDYHGLNFSIHDSKICADTILKNCGIKPFHVKVVTVTYVS